MSLPLKVIKPNGEEIDEPYLLRAAGWTEERYFKEAPETGFVEFEDGELIVHSPVNTKHQKITRFLTFLLTGYAGKRKLGEVLNGPAVVQLRPGLDYEPDIFFLTTEQLNQLGEEFFSGPPALVIEVVSKGTRNYDLKTKAAAYFEHGVPEYWAVDFLRETLFHHILAKRPSERYFVTTYTDGRLESATLPGFWIDVGWLWQEPLPVDLTCLEKILG